MIDARFAFAQTGCPAEILLEPVKTKASFREVSGCAGLADPVLQQMRHQQMYFFLRRKDLRACRELCLACMTAVSYTRKV